MERKYFFVWAKIFHVDVVHGMEIVEETTQKQFDEEQETFLVITHGTKRYDFQGGFQIGRIPAMKN